MFYSIRLRGAILAIWGSCAVGTVSAQQIQAVAAPSAGLSSSFLRPSPEMDTAWSLLASRSGHLVPGALPSVAPKPGLPRVFAPSQPREVRTTYPWKRDIVTTVFWIGERPTPRNPVPNTVSAWDKRWTSNYGGYDDPDPKAREGLLPKKFTPGQNPFYFALPYNDISKTGTKESARKIPWYEESFHREGRTILKGRWIAIRAGGKTCYAQWEDVGPFETDDWEYVFGEARPKTKGNKGAGLDVSPAVRDYLDFGGGYGTVDWRFVDVDEVPEGPWKQLGMNNPFVNISLAGDQSEVDLGAATRIRELRDRMLASLDPADGSEGAE